MKIPVILLWLCCFSSEAFALSYEYFSEGFFTSVHVLVVDPKEHAIRPAKAEGEEVARETVAALVCRYDASAGVSGGFWKPDGSPAGILKIGDVWYGTPKKPRGAIGWTMEGETVLIDRVLTNYSLAECPDSSLIEVFPVPESVRSTADDWKDMAYIVGGTPVLISMGNLIEDYSPEQTWVSFLVERFPRTAVGIRENGEWVFVVVDASFGGALGGMTMHELGELMLRLGCVDALNLGGGRSSTMVIEGAVVNEPSGPIEEKGKYVQAVSDAFLVFPRD